VSRIPALFCLPFYKKEKEEETRESVREKEEVYLTEEREITYPYLAAPACSLYSAFFLLLSLDRPLRCYIDDLCISWIFIAPITWLQECRIIRASHNTKIAICQKKYKSLYYFIDSLIDRYWSIRKIWLK